MMMSSAIFPVATSCASIDLSLSMTSRICRHTGVNPEGSVASSVRTASKLRPLCAASPTTTGAALLSKRISMGVPAMSAWPTITFIDDVTWSYVVQKAGR